MGMDRTNIERIRHRQPATPLTEYMVRLHYGNGGVLVTSPAIEEVEEAYLGQQSAHMASFAPAAVSVWGTWWAALPGLAVPAGSPGWQELVRQDYAIPL